MQNYDIEALWRDLALKRQGIVGDVYRTPDKVRNIANVPHGWIEIVAEGPGAVNLLEPWRAMPRFARYLELSLLDIGVGTGIGGPVMCYLLRDWKNRGVYGYEPGLMIGGAPATSDMVDTLEQDVGRVPDALRAAWLAHSFILLKNGRWLGSLRPEGYVIVRYPNRAARRSRGWVGGAYIQVECLEVLDPGAPVSGCLVRRPGEQVWWDHIIYRESSGVIIDSHRPSLEATFTDWDFSEWVDE